MGHASLCQITSVAAASAARLMRDSAVGWLRIEMATGDGPSCISSYIQARDYFGIAPLLNHCHQAFLLLGAYGTYGTTDIINSK